MIKTDGKHFAARRSFSVRYWVESPDNIVLILSTLRPCFYFVVFELQIMSAVSGLRSGAFGEHENYIGVDEAWDGKAVPRERRVST